MCKKLNNVGMERTKIDPLWIVLVIGIVVFAGIALLVKQERITWLDTSFFQLFSWVDDRHIPLFEGFSVLGSLPVIVTLTLLLIGYLVIVRKDTLGGLLVFAVVGGGNLLLDFIKEQMGRERPDISLIAEDGLAFPSGHAMIGIIIYGFLAYFVGRSIQSQKIRISIVLLCSVLALLAGISRFALAVHFPSDVIAGYALGLALFAWSVRIHKRAHGKFQRAVQEK